MRPTIALLTDFGLRDSYVGMLKGVIAGIAPAANVIDLGHNVAPQDIREGAFDLFVGHRYFPEGTVFCCVVDPGVGSDRRPVGVRILADNGHRYVFVGPDNGLLTGMLIGGGVAEAAATLDAAEYHLPVISHTFHGRDVFAPVAAHVASGVSVDALGRRMDPAELVRLPWQAAEHTPDGFEATILHHDQFGNLITNLAASALSRPLEQWRVRLDAVDIGSIHRSFSDVASGHPLAYVGSSGLLELAVRDGSAAKVLSVKPNSRVRVVRRA